MKASEIFNSHYEDLTQAARRLVETSDQFLDEMDFKDPEDLNQYAEEWMGEEE